VAKSISDLLAQLRPVRRREEAVCYSYEDSLFLCVVSEVRGGPGVQSEPFCRLSSADSDSAIGRTLTEIPDGSGRALDVKSPIELRDAQKEKIRAAGFSSERDLMKRAVLCLVKRFANSIGFTPTHNGGTRGETKGFHDLEEIASTISFPATDFGIAAALRAALGSRAGTSSLSDGKIVGGAAGRPAADASR
jgi:hypothetical protein